MHKNLVNSKSIKLFLLCSLLSGLVSAVNSKVLRVESFFLEREAEISLPVRISPTLVDAPPRFIELLPAGGKKQNVKRVKFENIYTSSSLASTPVDLNEFPIIQVKSNDDRQDSYGLELGFDTQNIGKVDTLVRIGNISSFTDMLYKEINFKSENFISKNLLYKIKQAVRFTRDEGWRFTAINAKIDNVTNGIVGAAIDPGGSVIFQKSFSSVRLSKTPWLEYEFELPNDVPLTMYLNAKINRGGVVPKLVTLFSEPVTGMGKQKLLVNLQDLLRKAKPEIKDGFLEDLIITFRFNESVGSGSQNIHIGLGKLQIFNQQIINENGIKVFQFPSDKEGTPFNLREKLEDRLNKEGLLTLLSARLVDMREIIPAIEGNFPRVRFLTQYQEKIPKLFVGEQFLLDSLSSSELNATLDQKIFFKKRNLWEFGRSNLTYPKVGSISAPLISFEMDLVLNIYDYNFFKTDFSSSVGEKIVNLDLFGIDINGKSIIQKYVLTSNKAVEIKGIHHLKKAILYHAAESKKIPGTLNSLLINGAQISSFSKTNTYQEKKMIAYAEIESSADKLIWQSPPFRFDIAGPGTDHVKLFPTFKVEKKIDGQAVIKYEINSNEYKDLIFYLRIRFSDGDKYSERILQLNSRGELPVSNVYLHGMDVIVDGFDKPLEFPISLLLKGFKVEYKNWSDIQKDFLIRPYDTNDSKVSYLEINKLLEISDIVRPSRDNFFKLQNQSSGLYELDATLSYVQILAGGRDVFMPKQSLKQGGNEFNYISDSNIELKIKRLFTSFMGDKEASISKNTQKIQLSSSKLLNFVYFTLTGCLIWLLGFKLRSKWIPYVRSFLEQNSGFYIVLILLAASACYLIFIDSGRNSPSWGGLLIVFAYGLATHFKIRPFSKKIWPFFGRRLSAPYFILFSSLLILIAILLAFKLDMIAEKIAVIGYFLLLFGVIIEFTSFAKEAQLSADSLTKKE